MTVLRQVCQGEILALKLYVHRYVHTPLHLGSSASKRLNKRTMFFSKVISTGSSSTSLGGGDTTAFITFVPNFKPPVLFFISRYGLKIMPTKYAVPEIEKKLFCIKRGYIN